MNVKACIAQSGILIALTVALLLAACPIEPDEPELIQEPIEEPADKPGDVTYTVTFTAGEGSGQPPASQKVAKGTDITLPAQGSLTPPQGKVFDGWKSEKQTSVAGAPSTETYFGAAGVPFTVNADVVFTAQWKDPIDPNKTYIKFINPEKYPVILYGDASRLEEIARVPATKTEINATTTVEADPKPQGTTFYPRFVLDIGGIPLNYDGALPIMLRVDEKKVNDVTIPSLSSIETGLAFIKIVNTSIYSLTFNKEAYELPPLGSTGSNIIMHGEAGAYQIQPGAVSPYKVLKNGSVPLAFPAGTTQFDVEMVYTFTYDGVAFTLTSATDLLQAMSMLYAPASVSASVDSASALTLTWEEVEGATSYRVYRSTSADTDFVLVGTASTLTYTDENLIGGTAYYYKVQGFNDKREGPLSAGLGVQILPVPPQIQAGATAPGTLTLTWTTAAGASSYKVYRSLSADTGFALLGTVNTLTYTDENLIAGTVYYYKVQAVNTDTSGKSPLSEPVAARILTVPQGTVQVESSSMVSLTWEAVEGASSYRVYRSLSEDTGFSLQGTVSEGTYSDLGMSPNTPYYYKLQAVNSMGESLLSDTLAIQILPVPLSLTVQETTTNTVSLIWATTVEASSYQVYRSTSSNTDFALVGTVNLPPYVDRNLKDGTTYYYKIRGINGDTAGESPLSNQVPATTTPIAIGNITYSSVSGGTWALQSDGSRKSPAIGHGGMTKARVSFTCNGATSITIQLRVSSERADYAFVSTLDNPSTTSGSGYHSGSRISGTQSVTVTIPVPSAGSHFVEIGYQKDGSGISGGDCAWFTVISN
jgi:fibronectin type 3 domain-containing protein